MTVFDEVYLGSMLVSTPVRWDTWLQNDKGQSRTRRDKKKDLRRKGDEEEIGRIEKEEGTDAQGSLTKGVTGETIQPRTRLGDCLATHPPPNLLPRQTVWKFYADANGCNGKLHDLPERRRWRKEKGTWQSGRMLP